MKPTLAAWFPTPVTHAALLALLVLTFSAPARAQQASPSSTRACPQQEAVTHEQRSLRVRTRTLDAQLDHWPLTLPIAGLAASVVGAAALAVVAERWDRPALIWGLATIPATGAITSLGFITHRAIKRQPFASEQRRLARRQRELEARTLMLVRTRCGDDATQSRAAYASILRIDAQLAHVKARSEAVSLSGPLTLTVSGTLMAGGLAFATLIDWLTTSGLDSGERREPNRPRLIGLGVGALAGVALAAGGVAWTVKRGRERREIERAALPLKQQRRGLELLLQPSASPHHAGFALNGRF